MPSKLIITPQTSTKLTTTFTIIGWIVLLFFIQTIPVSAQQWQQFKTSNSGLLSNDVKSLAKGKNGSVYVGTIRGLNIFNNGLWQQMNIGNTYYPSILNVWTAGESLWAGTEYNGLWGFYNNTWKNYDPNTSGNGIVGFGKSSRDSIYRLDKFGDFDVWNGTTWTELLNFFSQPNNLFIDRDDNVWLLSNNTGMIQYKNGTFKYWRSNIDPSAPGYMPSGSILDMVQDSAGIYWIASMDGLLRFDGQNFQVFNKQNSGIASAKTRCLAIDEKQQLWIGTWDGGVSKYNGNTWVTYNVKNSPLTSLLINDILVDTASKIWIADGSNPLTSPSNGQGIFLLEEDKDLSKGQLPLTPGSLSGKVISENQVVLSWVDLSDNESGFAVERSSTDSLHFEQVKFLMNNSAGFADLTVTASTYYYRVRATNSMGYSAYTNAIKVQPKYCTVNETSYGAYAVIKKVTFGDISQETTQCTGGYYDYLNQSTNLLGGQTQLLTVNFGRCNITSDPIIGGVAYIDWNGDGDFTDDAELVFFNNNINGAGEFTKLIMVPANVVPGTVTRMRIRAEDDIYANPIQACGYAEQTQDFTLKIDGCINNYWTGNVNNAWDIPGNWSCGTTPENYSNVVIGAGAVVVISSNITINKLTLDPGSSLTVNNGFRLTILN